MGKSFRKDTDNNVRDHRGRRPQRTRDDYTPGYGPDPGIDYEDGDDAGRFGNRAAQ